MSSSRPPFFRPRERLGLLVLMALCLVALTLKVVSDRRDVSSPRPNTEIAPDSHAAPADTTPVDTITITPPAKSVRKSAGKSSSSAKKSSQPPRRRSPLDENL